MQNAPADPSLPAVDGTSAVGENGDVVIFLRPADWADFRTFRIEGNRVALLAPGRGPVERAYGRLTVEALRGNGRVLVQEVLAGGREGRHCFAEASRGR